MKNKLTYLLSALLVLFSFFQPLKSQTLIGNKVADVSKKYDIFHVYKNQKTALNRVVFQRKINDKVEFLYAYCDSSEIIKIVLENEYSFSDEYYWSIDTTLNNSYSDFSEGFAAIMNKNTHLIGYIDSTSKIVITPQFTIADVFSEGLAYFAILERCNGGETRPNKMGYINKKGERVIVLAPKLSELYGCCYFKGSPFRNGIAIMSTREFGFDCNCFATIIINRNGKILNHTGTLLDVYDKPIDLY
jgi:hypothetical protein